MLGWLRSNTVAGVVTGLVTTAVLSAITGVWALPVRLRAVEEAAADNRAFHELDVGTLRQRHDVDIVAVVAHQAASDKVDTTVLQMLDTVQRQIVGVQRLLEVKVAFEAERAGISSRDHPRED